MTSRIRINAGGRTFETTRDTLIASGSGFFAALFGPTGSALRDMSSAAAAAASSGTKRPRSSDDESLADGRSESDATAATSAGREIFVDRDSDLFADVLAFMRSTRLPARVLRDADRLLDLKTEAEYFAYDALSAACDEARDRLKEALEKALKPEPEPKAESKVVVLSDRNRVDLNGEAYEEIVVPTGHVLYLVSATLAGPCRTRRYKKSERAKKDNPDGVEGCYIDCEQTDAGDFQFLMDRSGDGEDLVLAHVGLNHIHTSSESGIDVDFRIPLGICLDGGEDELVTLRVTGSAEWHVLYWVGDAEAIPGLTNGGDQLTRKKRKAISAPSGSNGNSEMLKTLALLGATSNLSSANMMAMGMLASCMLD